MASSKDYLTFVLEQLSDLDSISYRAMMGEYILYYRDKIVGGIYDDRLLVKPVSSAISLMPTATYELPYEGAKEMLLVDDVDSREFLCNLFLSMYDELPAPKKKNPPPKNSDKKPLAMSFIPTAKSTMPERLNILQSHRQYVLDQKMKWEEYLQNLDNKIEFYKQSIQKNGI